MDVKNFFETKRTYRKFRQDSISDEILADILTAARLYSSGANRQSIKYVVVKSKENVLKLNSLVKYAAYLPEEERIQKEGETPVMFIAVVHDTSICAPNETDAGLAIGNITTAAWMHGVGSCIMGAIDRPAIKEMLGIKEEDALHTVIAFGYPMKESCVVDYEGDIKYYLDDKGDTKVPKRKLSEIVKYFD